MKDMKRIVMIIMAVALIALPTMAEIQEWKSTSVLQGASGTYQAPITEVGAVGVQDMATTTENYTPAQAPGRPGSIRRGFEDNNDVGPVQEGSPIGDAVLPLTLMALAFCVVIYFRRRKAMK